jgi:hypothetical protein
MSELFNKDDHLTANGKADQEFSKAYQGMKSEIHRVSYERVTIMKRLLAWIYGLIHRDPNLVKAKQKEIEKYRSAKAFCKVKSLFKPEPSNSMSNADVLAHTRRNFQNGNN